MTGAGRVSTIGRWWPVGLWGGVILAASSVPGSSLDEVGIEIPDKLVHAIEYGVLGLLAFRAARRGPEGGAARSMGLAVLIAALTGSLDENYQRLIPLRDPSVADWVADVVGAAIGAGAGALTSVRAAAGRRRS